MRRISEKTYHSFFLIGIIVKALISFGEIVSGLAFAFFSYDTLYKAVFAIFGGELMESPKDLVWGLITQGFRGFSATPQSFWTFIFLSHGIVKIFLLTGLWREKFWAYPTSAAVFALLVIYQLYQIILTPSVFLWAVTVLDIAVILLIIHEYRYKKRLTKITA